jgi:transcriptional regulator with XRE-family HTH domain
VPGLSYYPSMSLNTNMVVGTVRVARERLGLTRERLAVQAGLSLSTVYLAERAGLVSRRTAEKLAPVLGVPVEQLLHEARP